MNWSEFHRTTQREKETPDAFWICLLEAGVTFPHLDLNCPKDQRILASVFVDHSAGDIREHFHQIVSKWSTLEILELCRIVNFTYDQTEKFKEEEERKEQEKERDRERRRKAEKKEELQAFAAVHNNRRQLIHRSWVWLV